MPVIEAGNNVTIGGEEVPWAELEIQTGHGAMEDVVWYDTDRHMFGVKARTDTGELIEGEDGPVILQRPGMLRRQSSDAPADHEADESRPSRRSRQKAVEEEDADGE